ncbi:hypothetical protein ACR6C2_22935 [Streptomyces sp. INA 01156]
MTSAVLLLLGAMAVAGTSRAGTGCCSTSLEAGGGRPRPSSPGLQGSSPTLPRRPRLGRAFGGWILTSLIGFLWAVVFWWGSLYILLAGTVAWRALFLPALVTSVCWTGLGCSPPTTSQRRSWRTNKSSALLASSWSSCHGWWQSA